MRGKPLAWFAFFRKERNGAIVLFVLAALLAVIPRLIYDHGEPVKIGFAQDSSALAEMALEQERYKDSLFERKPKTKKNFSRVGKAELMAMGFKPEVADKIIKARNQGKKFNSIADLSRETGMDSISLANIVQPPPVHKKPLLQVELNSADSIELTALPGIGAKTATRILNYREKLGGFCRLDQLMEIWYVDTVRLRQLFPRFTLDPSAVNPILVNHTSEEILQKHPYISKQQARILSSFIRQNKQLTREKFLIMPGFSDKERMRLLPYLDFD